MQETEQNLPEYRCPKKVKGKTQKIGPPSSPATALSLSLMRYTSECVCVPNEERLTSIYILSFIE